MDTARYRLLKLIDEADHHDRFRIYTPVTAAGEPIYVHAKVTIVDDRLLHIGSSNFNNRSMGFDTECDLVVEAVAGRKGVQDVRDQIVHVRNDLIAEHLATTPAKVAQTVLACGSLIEAIEKLRGDGRTLVPYVPDEPKTIEEALAENDLLDPEHPPSWTKRALQRLPLRGFFR